MKTIFITITKGLLARNILRSDFFNLLKQNKDFKILIFIPSVRNIEPPTYLTEEFFGENVKIEFVPNKILNFRERLFNDFISPYLIYSKSTELFRRFSIKQWRRLNLFSYFFHLAIYYLIGRWRITKTICRFFGNKFFHQTIYKEYFDKYNPDLVFSSSIVSHFDNDFLQEAKRRKIKTAAMPKSWDNIDNLFFRAEPDLFLVQNEIMKSETRKYHSFSPAKIKITGFPQFDIYSDKKIILPRQDYCQKKGFDQNLPILFLGSEGAWSERDEKIFGEIINAREKRLIPCCNILIRPHFTKIFENQYKDLRNFKNVFIDDGYRKSRFFPDNWDPSRDDAKDFVNTLFHCSILITFASTLALDAACFNKPIVAITYGVRFIKGEDKTKVMYETCHYQWVLKTGGIMLANNFEEILDSINLYLSDPSRQEKERMALLNDLCYKIDGQSGKRLYENIIGLLNK